MEPLQGTKVHTFFEKDGLGPHKSKPYVTKSEQFAKIVEKVVAEVKAERNLAGTGAASLARLTVKEELAKQTVELNKGGLDEARKKASRLMKERIQSRTSEWP